MVSLARFYRRVLQILGGRQHSNIVVPFYEQVKHELPVSETLSSLVSMSSSDGCSITSLEPRSACKPHRMPDLGCQLPTAVPLPPQVTLQHASGIPTETSPSGLPLPNSNSCATTFKLHGKSYILGITIGKGAHGTVRAGKLQQAGMPVQNVAVKVVHKSNIFLDHIPVIDSVGSGGGAASQVEQEIACLKLAGESGCRFLASLVDTFQDNVAVYIVMPLYKQDLLSRMIELRDQGLSLNMEIIKIYAAELFLGLQALHEWGIFHSDLKPGNILIAADGHLRIVDFSSSETTSGLSSGDRGTHGYAAPELCGSPWYSSTAADLYSYGVVLLEIIVLPCPIFKGDWSHDRTSVCVTADASPHPVDSCGARDLVQRLMHQSPIARPSKGQIRTHPFFCGIDWNQLSYGKLPALTTDVLGSPF
ncbi:kinase-like domain-containing protein [Mycena floridula]|nr:kinase-like domain-containing protein [Mycena floridula]